MADIEKKVAASSDLAIPETIGEFQGEIVNKDAALAFLQQESAPEPLTAEAERRLVRTIDWMLLPILAMCYAMQYLDKILVNFAGVMGIQKDTHIDTNKFSYMTLVFYISYVAFEFPHAYAIQKLPVGRYLGIMVTLWGVVVASTAACNSYAGLVTTRVLLGLFESAVAPGLILITAMWYKTTEQPLRAGIWYSSCSISGGLGGLISFGFQHYHGHDFRSWQIMFLVVGVLTVAVGLWTAWKLPNNPMTSKLSSFEKYHAIVRLRENQNGIENKKFKLEQVIECFRDPQTWLFAAMTISSNIPNGALSSFQSQIIKGFGFTSEQSALLQMPAATMSFIGALTGTYIATRWNQRWYCVIGLLMIGMLGGCLEAFLPARMKAVRLVGQLIANIIGSSIPVIYSWVAANYAGHTKKVTMNAILLASFGIGNIIGPLTFRNNDAPDYVPAKIAIVVTAAVASLLALTLRLYYGYENHRRDRLGVQHGDDLTGLTDLTDKGNLKFRYSY